MPTAQEETLWAKVNREHPDWPEERKQAWVFGIMRRSGWRPHQQQQQQQQGQQKG